MAEKVLVDDTTVNVKKVDVNIAEEKELTTIPGIGPALAQRIIRSRPYSSQQDVTRVSGIGNNMLERMKPYMSLEPDSAGAEDGMTDDPDAPFPDLPELPVQEPAGETPASPVRALALDAPPPIPLPDFSVEEDTLDLLEIGEEPIEPESPGDTGDELISAEAEISVPPVEEFMPETDLVNMLPEQPEKVEKAVEAAEPTPAPTESPRYVTRGQFIWTSLLLLVLAVAFGMALSLGILSGMNGGLRYVAPEQVSAISREVSTLTTRAGAMQDTLASVQARLDNLEALSGRIDALETTTGGLQTDVEALTSEVDTLGGMLNELSAQTTALRTEMDAITAQTTRFQGVMDGLRDLLNNLFPTD